MRRNCRENWTGPKRGQAARSAYGFRVQFGYAELSKKRGLTSGYGSKHLLNYNHVTHSGRGLYDFSQEPTGLFRAV
jgi:hypothetical protein